MPWRHKHNKNNDTHINKQLLWYPQSGWKAMCREREREEEERTKISVNNGEVNCLDQLFCLHSPYKWPIKPFHLVSILPTIYIGTRSASSNNIARRTVDKVTIRWGFIVSYQLDINRNREDKFETIYSFNAIANFSQYNISWSTFSVLAWLGRYYNHTLSHFLSSF